MKQLKRLKSATSPGVVQLALLVLLAVAWPVFGAAGSTWPALRDQDEEDRAILMRMADYLAKAPGFEVTVKSNYDAIQEDGQRIEFGERRKVVLDRPNHLRMETERSDGEQSVVAFDGQWLTIYRPEENIYARVEKPGTVDELMVYMAKDLQMILPLGRMLLSQFPQQLKKLVTDVGYVEENGLFDMPTDHLAIRTDQVDVQMWIAQGDAPLLQRVVITYKNAPGEPQFRADFANWTMSPAVDGGTFALVPPASAEQVPLLKPVRKKGSIPAPQGGME
jgi:hypothetical protein